MFYRRLTRREFLGFNVKAICFLLLIPLIRVLKNKSESTISHREASFYKKLAG